MGRSGGCSVVPAGCRDGGEPGSLGGLQTTFAATASCPSRNTVAVIGRCSPTTARVENDPQDTTGATSEMPRRRSGRPVIAATLSRSPAAHTSAADLLDRPGDPPGSLVVRARGRGAGEGVGGARGGCAQGPFVHPVRPPVDG